MHQNNGPLEIEVKVDTLFSRTKNKNIPQSLWVFVIRKKSIQQIWKKNSDTDTKIELDDTKIELLQRK